MNLRDSELFVKDDVFFQFPKNLEENHLIFFSLFHELFNNF